MNIGLYQSAASLSALERWQDAVTQNITSSQVSGYKKRTVNFSEAISGELQADPRARNGEGSGEMMHFPKVGYGISFQQGETQPTRRDLDVALQGDGFFEIQLEDGRRAYTRAGELRQRADRTLVTSHDTKILSESGDPITLLPGNAAVVINPDGRVIQGGTPVGKLSVVKFADNQQLVPLSAGAFINKGPPPTQVERPEVLQGYLESSNITPLREMVDLVNIARAYEANQKLIQTRDQSLGKTLEVLG
ncbi:MAG: flagellar hook-basal body protein [Opitutaceae bacterium]|nr:flagellar hook-basal body protein [Opitutaceae bacterium]